ncbi:MAG: hypothetical protein F2534_04065 [Actinobacteria bacterium]|uniref:Unannotated protein n=1 Tax=freshwater metagenome TaxID=449393 RepID=A0A6J6C7Q9_9ZZZZ|nr:hypothetical protein [Actinomycetota bacterium]
MTLPGVAVSASLLGSPVAAELTEEEAAVRVFLAAGGLVLLGVGLACMTVWWWRSTRPEPPALGPLEVMSDRRWRTAGDSERRRMVDETRPEGADGRDLVVAPEPIDLSELVRGVPSFDDLRDVSLESDRPAVPEVAVADLEALELASSTAGASTAGASPTGVEPGSVEPGSVESGSVESGAPSTTAADDETVAMVDPNVADPAAPEADAANDADAAAETSADDVAGADDHASDGSTDATIAQPRPVDLGHPVGRD